MGFPPFCGESLKNLPILNICIKTQGVPFSLLTRKIGFFY
jgi:hypothetical protein